MKDGKIENYQAVVPSTWNAGPRDGKGQKGRTRHPSWETRSRTPDVLSRFSGPCTPSIRAWRAPPHAEGEREESPGKRHLTDGFSR